METTNTPLQQVAHTLESYGLKVSIVAATSEIPFDFLLTTLGMDEYNKAILLQVQQQTYPIENGLPQSSLSLISFVATVPLQIPDEQAPEILRLLALSNKSLPFGALNYSEVEKAVYFSYTLPLLEKTISETLVATILRVCLFTKETFFSLIHEVALGNETVTSLLEEEV